MSTLLFRLNKSEEDTFFVSKKKKIRFSDRGIKVFCQDLKLNPIPVKTNFNASELKFSLKICKPPN